jgi:3-phosphoshikimate 1-carboxyvinyltransferase
MAMAVAAIRCDEPVYLTGWTSVNKSYPGFWRDYEKFEKGGRPL